LPKPTRRIEGFQRAHWLRWGQLVCTERPGEARGGLLVVTAPEGGTRRVDRVVHTERGVLEVAATEAAGTDATPVGEAVLAELAEREDAAWVLALDQAALGALRSTIVPLGDGDYLERVLELWSSLIAMQHGGALDSWPHQLESWPFLAEVLPYGLDAALGEGQSAVVAVWRGGELYTALALRKHHAHLDRVLGPDFLVPAMGLASGDFRRDYRYLSQVVERELGPLAFGFFGHHGAVRELLRRESPRAWAEAVAAREVIVSPMSSAVALPVGIDVGRALLRSARNFLGDLGLGGFVPPDVNALLEPVVSRPDLRDLMGFDPFELIERAAQAPGRSNSDQSEVHRVSAGG
jgi:hypothetical protein